MKRIFTLILALSLLFSFRAEDMNMADMAGMIKLGVDQVNRIYPLAGMYTAGIVGGNIAALAGFPAVSLGVFLLFSALVQWKYVSISSACIPMLQKRITGCRHKKRALFLRLCM